MDWLQLMQQRMQGPNGMMPVNQGLQMPQRPMPGQMGPMQQFAPQATPGINPVDNPMMRRANTLQMAADQVGQPPPEAGGMSGMGPMMMGFNMMNQPQQQGPSQQDIMAGQGMDRMQQLAMMMRQRMGY